MICVQCQQPIEDERQQIYLNEHYLKDSAIAPSLPFTHDWAHAHPDCVDRPEHLSADDHFKWLTFQVQRQAKATQRNADAIRRIEDAMMKLPDEWVDEFKHQLMHVRDTYGE